MDTPGNSWLSAALAVLKAQLLTAAGLHNKLHLIAQAFAPSPSLDPAGLTQATYDGYAPLDIDSFSAEHIIANGNYIINSLTAPAFSPTGSTVSNTIYGWWLEDTQGNVVSMGLLPTPKVMAGAGDVLIIVPVVGMGLPAVTSTILP